MRLDNACQDWRLSLFKSVDPAKDNIMANVKLDKKVSDITGGKCFYCGMKFGLLAQMVKDHFIPKVQGGTKLVPACVRCNLIKGSLSLEDFRIKASDPRVISRYAHKDHPIVDGGLFYFEKAGIQP